MNKLKAFLVADAFLIAGGLVFFLILFLRRNAGENRFREDIWEKKKRAAEDQVDRKILLEHRPDPAEAEEKPASPGTSKEEFAMPNFRGRPHEILGIPPHPHRDLVTRAYKHWIKRYHPDRVAHLGETYVAQARRRAEQLNTARDELLKAIPKQ